MQIEYEVRESSPELGLGLFTKQFIPKGGLIWKYERGVNVLSYGSSDEVKDRLNQMSSDEQYFFMSHIYIFDGCVNEILDDAKMWNHSENPNTGYGVSGDWNSSYAIRDIEPGEELLDDYGIYEYPSWFLELAKEYGVPQDFITKKDSKKPGFHIEYEIKDSVGKGRGIFSKQFIPVNTLIWKYSPGHNVRQFKNESEVRLHLSTLSFDEQQFWMSHVYMDGGFVNEILDDGKMWNHSEAPNTGSGYLGDSMNTYAIRDIQIGEELLDDYGAYEYPQWFVVLCEQYNHSLDFFTIKASTL